MSAARSNIVKSLMRTLVANFERYAVVAGISLVSGVFGGLIAIGPLSIDKSMTILASVGSLGAAIATFLTVREMRDARIDGARARLTSPGNDRTFHFDWKLNSKNEIFFPSSDRIIVRNAATGAAKNIDVEYVVNDPLTTVDVEQINFLINPKASIQLGQYPSTISMNSLGSKPMLVLVPISETVAIGDLGPGQELYAELPATVINHICLKWLSLILKTKQGAVVHPHEVPSLIVNFRFDSIYERELLDAHILKFHVNDVGIVGARAREVASLPSEALSGIRFGLRVEFSPRATSHADSVVI